MSDVIIMVIILKTRKYTDISDKTFEYNLFKNRPQITLDHERFSVHSIFVVLCVYVAFIECSVITQCKFTIPLES